MAHDPRPDHDVPPSASDERSLIDDAELTRRRFLTRAGQFGALSLIGSRFAPLLGARPVHAPPLPPMEGGASEAALAADDLAALYSGLRWRMLGPFRGGRTDAVSGVPGRPNEFYFGHVNGGVWKTHDAGRVWEPVFDSQPVASIGALAVAPSAPDVVYVGTGESTLRDSNGYGNGMYRSTDAGKTWTHIGLDDTQHIGRIAVHPRDPNVVFVAAIGHMYAANPDRGVFRTRDGGKSWQKVLYKGPDVGAIEVVIDPHDPRVVYAGLWNTRRPPWFVYAPTNGPGGGIFKSTDGGDTWTQLTNGLPPAGIGRTGIAVAPTDSMRLYAVVDCLLPDPAAARDTTARAGAFGAGAQGQGGFFRSDDAGATWKRLSADPALWGRGWYFEHVVVDPKDADTVYVSNVSVSRSMDGGRTWVALRGSPGGDDYHQAWISPDDTNTMIVASDQGTIITRNARAADPREVTWSSWLNQPTAQMYHVSVDYRDPYWVTGAQQDSGAVAVRSRGKFGEISMRDWEPAGAGGESGYTAGDPLHPGVIYGGEGQRYDLATNTPIPNTTTPQLPEGEKPRTDWTQPLVLSKADPRQLYYANQYLFRSVDGARSWTRVSPDLTRADPGVPSNLDATAAAQIDSSRDPQNAKRGVIYTIAPSPLLVPMVWIGTDDGYIQLTTDGGKTWRNVTPPVIAPWSRVTMIQASHHDVDVAYASVDRHQLQDFEPYVYRTRDRGKSWQRITGGLPTDGYVHVVKEDPDRQGLLFAGTERGAFISFDDGDSWRPLQLNLPVTSVRDFQVYDGDLIVGTHGRGIWVIDDIAPIRQATPAIASTDVYLFQPSDITYRAATGDDGTPMQKDEPMAPNPPAGGYIDYYLARDARGPVTLEILDASGKVVHTFSSEQPVNQPGGRGGRTGGIPNTSPLWRPEPARFETGAGMHRVAWIPVAQQPGGGFFRRATPLLGTFTARLTANGKTVERTFAVRAPDAAVTG